MDNEKGTSIIVMTAEQAVARDNEIVNSASTLRLALHDMYAHDGWHVLGFSSWQAYLVNVSERAGLTPQTLRKQTRTALLESNTGHEIGTFREGAVRPINDILSDRKGYTEEMRADALDRAIDIAGSDDDVTSPIAKASAYYIAVENNAPSPLVIRMRSGEIDPETAFGLTRLSNNINDTVALEIIYRCSDLSLAAAILNIMLSGKNDELVHEIWSSGYVPSKGGAQIPLESATIVHLASYMREQETLEYADAKAMERKRMFDVCNAARNFMLTNFGDKIPQRSSHPYEYEIWKTLTKLGMIEGGNHE